MSQVRDSPGGSGRRAVAVQGLGAVGAAGGGGAVGVQGDRPAPLVNSHLMVEEAEQGAAGHAGGAAVGQVGHMVHLAGRGGLVAAAELVVTHQGTYFPNPHRRGEAHRK